MSELVHRPSGPQTRLIGPGFGHERDVGIGEGARRGPQARPVHGPHPAATELGRGELRGEGIGLGALTPAVVTGGAVTDGADGTQVDAGCGVLVDQDRRHGVEEAQSGDESTEPVHHVHGDDTAHITTDHAAVLVTKLVMDQRVEVAAVGDDVVGVIGRQIRIPVTTQIGDDHLVAGGDQRLDVAPPDPFGLRIAVDEQQRSPTDALMHVRE